MEQVIVEAVNGAGQREERKRCDTRLISQVDNGKVAQDVKLTDPMPFTFGLGAVLRVRLGVALAECRRSQRSRLQNAVGEVIQVLLAGTFLDEIARFENPGAAIQSGDTDVNCPDQQADNPEILGRDAQ